MLQLGEFEMLGDEFRGLGGGGFLYCGREWMGSGGAMCGGLNGCGVVCGEVVER